MSEFVILNVDDNEAARYVRNHVLRAAGYRIRDAGCGLEALRIAAAETPDLVLLDVNLPDISGLEVCRRIRSNPLLADTAVMHLSASSIDPQHRVEGLRGGADAYLTEPVEPEVLIATVTALLRTRRAERALRETEHRYRRLFEANVVGTATADAERILEANDAFLAMLGCTRDDLAAGGIAWKSFTAPEYLPLDERAIAELRDRGACTPFEKEFIRKDGTRVPILIGAAVVDRAPDLRWVCFVVDLTERKRLEEQLRNAHRLEGVGLLAGGVAHDFNNLLTGIMGNIGLALESLPPMEACRDMLQDALRACQRAADLTRQLLAYAGKGRFFVTRIDLSKLIGDFAPLIRATVPRKIRLAFDLAPGLPYLEADPSQIQQSVMNLITNAVEAIGDRPGAVTVSTGLEEIENALPGSGFHSENLPAGTYLYLEVCDTGCGMDAETCARIFDPFFTTKFMGRGLGLAAAGGIARAHKGAVRVSSQPGRGSTFRMLFPAGPAAGAYPEKARSVLVVDDEELVRAVAKASLEQCGYSVLVADSGPAAIELLRRHARGIALIVLDMAMPVMSGEEALQHFRALCPRVPVVVCSGFSESETKSRFAGQSVDVFLQKPFTPSQLTQKVRELIP